MNTDEIVMEAIAPAVQPPQPFQRGKGLCHECGRHGSMYAGLLELFKAGTSRGTALEASAFNGGREFLSPQAAQTSVGQGSQESPGKVVPLGTVFGIKLFTDGVIVASLSDLYTSNGVCCPAAEAGILPGDYLLEADGMEIPSNQSLAEYIGQSAGEAITFQVRRGDQVFETQVTPVYGEGSFKTGMWVRDSAAGIGTLTFTIHPLAVLPGWGTASATWIPAA